MTRGEGYLMDVERLAQLLERRGWLAVGERRYFAVRDALADFQAWHDLKADAVPGPVTERVLTRPRFCGLADRQPVRATLCKWPHLTVRWHVRGALPGITGLTFNAAVQQAFGFWSQICGVEHVAASISGDANIVIDAAPIDRAGGTLAWSELPCGVKETSQLKQLYDTREPWKLFDVGQSFPGNIDLVRVIAHELGHALGIDHLAAPGNLMNPYYSEQIRRPQTEDIAQAVLRYGRPAAPPPVDPPVDPPIDPPSPREQVKITLTLPADAVSVSPV